MYDANIIKKNGWQQIFIVLSTVILSKYERNKCKYDFFSFKIS